MTVVGRGGNAAPRFACAAAMSNAGPSGAAVRGARHCVPCRAKASERHRGCFSQAPGSLEMNTGDSEILYELALNPYTPYRPMALVTRKFAHTVAMALALLTWPALASA